MLWSSASRMSRITWPPTTVTVSLSGTTQRPSRCTVAKNAVTDRESSSRTGWPAAGTRSVVSEARSPRVRAW